MFIDTHTHTGTYIIQLLYQKIVLESFCSNGKLTFILMWEIGRENVCRTRGDKEEVVQCLSEREDSFGRRGYKLESEAKTWPQSFKEPMQVLAGGIWGTCYPQ